MKNNVGDWHINCNYTWFDGPENFNSRECGWFDIQMPQALRIIGPARWTRAGILNVNGTWLRVGRRGWAYPIIRFMWQALECWIRLNLNVSVFGMVE